MSEGASISLIESVILGFVQGVTEFLPVSSSGHLVILQHLFGAEEAQVLFDVMLHVGTLAAIFVVFRKDIAELAKAAFGMVGGKRPESRYHEWMLKGIAVGCIPTAVIGLAFSQQFERLFASTTAAGIGLLATGSILMSTAWKSRAGAGDNFSARIRLTQALLIGAAQGIAIFPGISRSGATIAVALVLGVERESAARFSFLLAVPAILGALAFEMKDYLHASYSLPAVPGAAAMLLGMLVAAVTGIIALKFLIGVVKKGKISLFAYYCWALGLLAVGYGFFRG